MPSVDEAEASERVPLRGGEPRGNAEWQGPIRYDGVSRVPSHTLRPHDTPAPGEAVTKNQQLSPGSLSVRPVPASTVGSAVWSFSWNGTERAAFRLLHALHHPGDSHFQHGAGDEIFLLSDSTPLLGGRH